MPVCYSCGTEIAVIDRVGRRETCPACSADLHCCRGCKFFDPASYNECREPVAERVIDKEAGNFCDFFQIAERVTPSPKDPATEARKKLGELFKKR